MTDAELTALIVKLNKLYQAYGHGESYQNLLRDFQNPTDDGFRERWQFVKFSGMGGLDDEYLVSTRQENVEFYLLAAELFDELIRRGIRPPESARVSKQLREMAEWFRQ